DLELRVVALAVFVAGLARPAAAQHSAIDERVASPVRRNAGRGAVVALFTVVEAHGACLERADEKHARRFARAVDVRELGRKLFDRGPRRDKSERGTGLAERVTHVERGADLALETRTVERRSVDERTRRAGPGAGAPTRARTEIKTQLIELLGV